MARGARPYGLRLTALALTTRHANLAERMMDSILNAIFLFLRLFVYVLMAQVIMSWLINFQVLNLRQPTVARIWDLLNRALAPVYTPIRRFLPTSQGIDFSPMVVIVGILLIEKLLVALTGTVPAY
jgi:YggT family protein